MFGDFNAITASNQTIILSNNSSPHPLWLYEDGNLVNRFKRNFNNITENLFSSNLLKLHSSQGLTICNGINKWPTSCEMTCIHGLGSNVVDYTISDTHVLNCFANFELLNDHEINYDHKPLSLTPNLVMHTNHREKNCENQMNNRFDKSKKDLFLH